MEELAVEWLQSNLKSLISEDGAIYDFKLKTVELFNQAKAMEKAEKDKQYQRGFKDGSKHIKIIYNL